MINIEQGDIKMINFEYQGLYKALFYVNLLLTPSAAAENPSNLEEKNIFEEKKPICLMQAWEAEMPQEQAIQGKINSPNYFTKMHPELLEQASQNLSRKSLSKKAPNDEPDFDDPRY